MHQHLPKPQNDSQSFLKTWRKSSFLWIFLSFITFSLQAQEICDNGIDDDGDGFVDFFDPDCPCNLENFFGYCADGCQFTTGFSFFAFEQRWESAQDVALYVTPLAADVDGDGFTDIIMASNNSFQTGTPRRTKDLRVFDGRTGTQKFVITTDFYSWAGPTPFVVGDIDGDGFAEIIVATTNHTSNAVGKRARLVCYKRNASGVWVEQWISDTQYGDNATYRYGATPALADFNQDGIPEVYIYNEIFNAQTGVKLAGGGANGIGVQRQDEAQIGSIANSIAANLDANRNDLELAAGYTIYKVNIGNPNGTTGNTMTAYNITVDGNLRDGYTSIADINLDGQLDVVVGSGGTATTSRLYVYYLNGTTPTLIASTAMPTSGGGGGEDNVGPPFIGDMDGDINGAPEIGVVRKERLIAYKYNGTTTLQEFWVINTNDTSGETALTMFDFNQDGKQEIVYRDETTLRVIDGSTATPTDIQTVVCFSGTGAENPIIANITGNGAAEICVPCGVNSTSQQGKLRVYQSPSQPWAPARKVWNQYSYHVMNVNDNLTIPRQQQSNAASFGASGRIFNNFMVQASSYDKTGDYFRSAADAAVTINEAKLIGNNLNINFNLTNTAAAAAALPPQTRVAFYSGNPTIAGATLLGEFITPNDVSIAPNGFLNLTININYVGGDFDLFAVANLLASATVPITGVADNYRFLECNYTNNRTPDMVGVPVVRARPDAQPDINSTLINQPVSGNVLSNDSNPAGGALTVTAINGDDTEIGNPFAITGGTVTLEADGTYSFTPVVGFVGEATFTYTIENTDGQTATTTVYITVYDVATARIIAQNDVVQVIVGQSVVGDVLSNDFSTNTGDVLIVNTTPFTAPANGVVILNPDGTFEYTPNCVLNECFVGQDTFEYQVCNQFGDCQTATVFITVSPRTDPNANTPPFAQDDAFSSVINTLVTGNVLGNDSDPDGDNLTVTAVTTPTNVLGGDGVTVVGTYTIAANGVFVFTPNAGYTGPANFTYQVCDNGSPSLCDNATVYLTVRPSAPIANDDINNALAGTTVAGNVLTNDTDPHGGTLEVTTLSVITAAGVTVTIDANGNYTYTPNASAITAGVDSFTYTVCNPPSPDLCSGATVTINVLDPNSSTPNTQPSVHDDLVETLAGVTVSANVLANDFDPDLGQTLTLTEINGAPLVVGTPLTIIGGTITFIDGFGNFEFVPNPGFTGATSFEYEVCDSGTPQECKTATVTINVYSPSITIPYVPFAQDDTNVGLPATLIAGNVLDNDADPNTPTQTLSVSTFTDAAGNAGTVGTPFNLGAGIGLITLNANGTYSFAPEPLFVGTVIVQYTAQNTGLQTSQATLYLTVVPPGPVLENDINVVLVGSTTTGNVFTNDRDPLGGPLTISSVTGTTTTAVPGPGATTFTAANGGTVAINPDGTYTYTPSAASIAAGEDSFTYTVCNATTCSQATVTINVLQMQSGNNPPMANNDQVQTFSGITASGNVLNNDSDPDKNLLTVTGQTVNNANGIFTLNPEGTFTFEPAPGVSGTFVYTYQVCDNATPAACSTAEITVIVYPAPAAPPANYPPFAQDDAQTGGINTVLAGNVLLNDFDPNTPDDLVVTAQTNVTITGGTYSINTTGEYTFTPNAGFTGTTSFTYTISNAGGTDVATVYLTAHPVAPQANDDILNVLASATNVAGNVLTNDFDPNGATLTVSTTTVTTAQGVTVTIDANGNYTYTPNAAAIAAGTDSFTYTVCNDLTPNLCSEATAFINVFAPQNGNNPPLIHNDVLETYAGTTAEGNVLSNDNELDFGQTLTVTEINGDDTGIGNPFAITGGTVTLEADGTYTFVPNAGFTGTTSFTYTACDNATPQACETATVNITVYPASALVNDPPFAQDDAQTGGVNQSIAGNVLANDSDPNNPPNAPNLTVTRVNGAVFTVGTGFAIANGSLTIVNTTGEYEFTPNAGFIGTTSFTYTVSNAGGTDVATVYLTVHPVAPAVSSDINNTLMNTPVTGNLLTNDSDPNGGTLVGNVNTTPVAGPSSGTIQINADGTYTYTPNFGFEGTDVVTYEVCNAAGLCETATLTITVQQQLATGNNAPVANNDVGQTLAGVDLSGNVLANDFDRDGDIISGNVSLVTGLPVGTGSLTLNVDGTYTYLPGSFVGETSFTYQVCDGDPAPPAECNQATVFITVYPESALANNPPFAQDDAAFVYQSTTTAPTSVSGNALANDFDPDGVGTLTVVAVGTATNVLAADGTTVIGTYTIDVLGDYVFTPAVGYTGPASFTYEVCNAASLCDVATVHITVQAESPRAPIARNDLANTLLNTAVSGVKIVNDLDVFSLRLVSNSSANAGPSSGTVVFNADGTYTYTPSTGFTGTDEFQYEICNSAGLCDIGTVKINIVNPQLGSNNAPIVQDDYAETLQGTTVSGDVLANDFDYDGDVLRVTEINIGGSPTAIPSGGNSGSITFAGGTLIVNFDGTFTLTNPTTAGAFEFDYTVCDNGSPEICRIATVFITVYSTLTGVPNLPFAQNDALATSGGSAVTSNVINNDSNLGTVLSLTVVTPPNNGTLLGPNINGDFTYTPDTGYEGPDFFVYEVCNDDGCSQAMVSLTNFDAVSPLPISLLSFTATLLADDTVKLEWITVNEQDNARFEVYRSADAQIWEMIGSKDGAGNSITRLDYSLTDVSPLAGLNYYRLKQIDLDGTFTYSQTIAVNVTQIQWNVYPNPTADFINVQLDEAQQSVLLFVSDAKGRLIQTYQMLSDATGKLHVDMKGLSAGAYYLQIQTKGQTRSKVIIKN